MAEIKVSTLMHPDFLSLSEDWEKFRFIMEGGDAFIEEYLVKFSDRETALDFDARKSITPVPGFAAAALIDIKNAIFQRQNPKQFRDR